MGLIQHNVIVATTWDAKLAVKFEFYLAALDIPWVKSVAPWNGYITFFVGPDGSKEGWAESNNADTTRNKIVARLAEDNYEDDSSPWDWIEIGYGELGPQIVRTNTRDKVNGP
jgi:hypothetical protein